MRKSRYHIFIPDIGSSSSFIHHCSRECITVHPSFSETFKILNTHRLTETSSFYVKGESIEFKTGVKGDENLTITAINEVEHQHWCYALVIAVARLRKDASKTIVPPPHYPVHSGYLLCLDPSMKWRRKYVVLTEDSLFINEHRRVGFGTPPLRYSLVSSSCLLVPFVTLSLLLYLSIHLTISPSLSQCTQPICHIKQTGPKRNDIQHVS